MVCNYTNLNFNEADNLDCVTFKMLVRDAFVDKMEQSEEGRDYLDKCWTLSQTTPDYKSLKEKLERR